MKEGMKERWMCDILSNERKEERKKERKKKERKKKERKRK